MSELQLPYIAFIGTPNSGKTTLFNVLTGMRRKVGNFPGVTIEPSLGVITDQEHTVNVIDLPGSYSLNPNSPDEELMHAILHDIETNIHKPNSILFIMDATNLEKGLYLFSQVATLGFPMAIALTMIDSVKARSGYLDDIALERILGVPIFPIVGHKGIGLDALKTAICTPHTFAMPKPIEIHDDIYERVSWARKVSEQTLKLPKEDSISAKLDAILLHPIGGILIFLAIMILFFQSIFSWAAPLMDLIESMFGFLQDQAIAHLPEGIITDFVARGIIAGVGSVVVFLPQIIFLNIIIVILEDCGYLARAAFLVDRIMGLFGLQGRSFIPLLGSYACAIPGILSARIIPSKKDRMITMLISPLMTCSARLPVYTLLISAFIPPTIIGGFFSLQASVLAGLYALAGITGLLIALVMKKTMFKGDVIPFLMEFPAYRMPSIKSLIVTVIDRVKDFLQSAGTVIVVFSIILWFLSSFPRIEIPQDTSPIVAQQMQLEQSFAGTLGKAIAPIFEPLGFDWKLTVGVIGSFAAREMFVTVMSQLYATDISLSDITLRQTLQQAIPFASALSVLAFYVYALQCISTMSVLKRETGSWKWSAFAFTYSFVLAYVFAFVVYNLSK